eukprot:gnl/TRDRNA2_/TRDRNA2_90188_c0_seq1.p1 gnl/TRDRNA2_/TRDRNA2_90188_c0~~gnl/TRDRNA2_/TRDRNA2_90188_c0_seq1.p1  ORF type:complete len:184 (+),score=13.32 gnl/TRDRNA2_/TRDRNA2_90188_c0_seq1:36-554(+)
MLGTHLIVPPPGPPPPGRPLMRRAAQPAPLQLDEAAVHLVAGTAGFTPHNAMLAGPTSSPSHTSPAVSVQTLAYQRPQPCPLQSPQGLLRTATTASTVQTPVWRPGHVWFNSPLNSSIPITPYSERFGTHPRYFNFDRDGQMYFNLDGDGQMQPVARQVRRKKDPSKFRTCA